MQSVRLIDFVPAMAVAALAFVSVVTMTVMPALGTPDARTGQVGVIFSPWVTLTDGVGRIGRAHGRTVRQGLFANILVAQPDDERFMTEIYRQGALLVIDPSVLGGCLTTDRT